MKEKFCLKGEYKICGYRTSNVLPKDGEIVDTKVDDWRGCRNEQRLKFSHNLWWIPDGSTYVYYNPTHWKYSWM